MGSINVKTTPLLSIIIPTKNRKRYLTHSILSILGIEDVELELVISDNSESDELMLWMSENVNDSRVRYCYTSNEISMTDNYNKAMTMASGEYVCTLGDDDSVNPLIMEIVRWAKLKGIDALSSKNNSGLVYFWPDFLSRTRGMGLAGKLFIDEFSGEVKRIDVEAELIRCVENAGQGSLGLPRVYHGVIKRSCLMEVFDATGAFFKGVSPDVYGAIIVSKYLKNAYSIDYPLTIGGSSGGSNAGRAAQGTHKGSLKDDPHTKAFNDLIWPSGVPDFFSVETVWASATIEAIKSSKRKDLLTSFDFSLLHALCAIRHPDYIKPTLKSYINLLAEQRKSIIFGYLDLLLGILIVNFRFSKHVLAKILPRFMTDIRRVEYAGIQDINEASCCVVKNIKKIGSVIDIS